MIVKRIVYLRLKFIKIGCENLKKYHVNIMEEIAITDWLSNNSRSLQRNTNIN